MRCQPRALRTTTGQLANQVNGELAELAEASRDAQAAHRANMAAHASSYQSLVRTFRSFERRLAGVSGSAGRIGDRLGNISSRRWRAVHAKELLRHYGLFVAACGAPRAPGEPTEDVDARIAVALDPVFFDPRCAPACATIAACMALRHSVGCAPFTSNCFRLAQAVSARVIFLRQLP